MITEVQYSADVRIVVELNQLSDKTEIGDGGFLLPPEGDEI